MAPTREESGDKKSTRIEVVRSQPKNHIGKKLGEMLDYEKAHKPVKLARSRVAAQAAALRFKELVASIDGEYNQGEQ